MYDENADVLPGVNLMTGLGAEKVCVRGTVAMLGDCPGTRFTNCNCGDFVDSFTELCCPP